MKYLEIDWGPEQSLNALMFSPLRQAASAQLLNQGIGKNGESEVWILNMCLGAGEGWCG